MERKINDSNILNEFTEKFCKLVEKHSEYIIVSGFLVIASGRARGTEDIDMILPNLSIDKFKEIHDDLVSNGFVCMQSSDHEIIYEYLHDNSSVRYTYKDKPLPEMEVKFSKDELDDIQLKNKIKLELTGLDIWFSEIEMNIAFKEEYLKSDKDIEDARHLRIVYEEEIDEKKVKEYKKLIRRYRL